MMQQELLAWCKSELGVDTTLVEEIRQRDRSATYRLRIPARDHLTGQPAFGFLKVHEQPLFWGCEVNGYRQWASIFGSFAPKLLATRNKAPLAIVISELAGRSMADSTLSAEQEVAAWQSAGQHLAELHQSAQGDWFGPSQANGLPADKAITDAQTYISGYFDEWIQRGDALNALTPSERSIIQAAQALIPAFAGESPVPCHRDYCPVNWMVDETGKWAGVIDFEFAYWDVRVADFTRFPDWEWIEKPYLIEAFFDGYGRKLTVREEEQCLIGHAQYALSAIVWGQEASYFGFKAEGQAALKHLARLL